ncbi:MAG TPA: BTAD domain-containing putative transcriptional regulator, partial [Anaerolineae bacterium]
MTVELCFLGVPQIRKDGQTVEIKSAKAIALLAYLAVTDRPQPRERIMALLWGESAEEAARKNLRNTLWTIRRELGDELVASGDDRLGLARSTWTDVRSFAEAASQVSSDGLATVMGLYRGPLLDGVKLVEAPDFEVWTTTERERFTQLYLRGLSALVTRYRAQGEWDQVIATAQSALAQDNLQEPMYRALMEAYALLGDRPAALHQFEILRAVLDRELGVEPLPETANLAKAILEGAAPAPVVQPMAPSASTKQDSGDREPLFVGRVAEREILDEELAAATRAVRVVLLSGEVGIGKSRLWQEWSAGLDASWTIVAARCLESTQSLPFAPLLQLLRTPALQAVLGAAPRVPLVWLTEITRLMPELRLSHSDLATPAPFPAAEERRRLSEAIVQTLLTLGSAGLVFFLDDAHWADQATLDWLGYLVERLRDRPLLAVVSYRPEDAPAGLIRLAAGWTRQGVVRRLSLGRLSQEESAALISELKVEPTSTHLVQAQGAGNPYFLIELAHSRRPDGPPDQREGSPGLPPALAELVRDRLERLSGPTRQVLQAAAILEPDIDFAALRRAGGRDEEETLDALDELFAAGILQENRVPVTTGVMAGSPGAGQALPLAGPTFNFAHPLVADVVRADLSGARRRYLYRRVAEALEAIHAGHLDEVAGRLAHAYFNADDPKRAATYDEMAARRA